MNYYSLEALRFHSALSEGLPTVIVFILAMSSRVSDNEIKEVAWAYIKDGDLELLTRKKLCEHIRSSLGDNLQRGDGDLKLLVKKLVPQLLDKRDRMEMDAEAQVDMRQASQQDHKPLSPTPKPPGNSVREEFKSEKRTVSNAEVGNCEPGRIERDTKQGVKRRRVSESDGSGCSDDAQSCEEGQTSSPVKRTKKKAVPASRGKADKRLSKMLSVARQLGCRIPPRVLRCEEEDKIDACNEYLRSKGVKGQVLQMTSAVIKEMRQRLDREKELDELDTCNIIQSGSRRRRSTVVNNVSRPSQDSEIRREIQDDDEERKAEGGSCDAPADQGKESSASSESSESSQQSESEFELSDDSS